MEVSIIMDDEYGWDVVRAHQSGRNR